LCVAFHESSVFLSHAVCSPCPRTTAAPREPYLTLPAKQTRARWWRDRNLDVKEHSAVQHDEEIVAQEVMMEGSVPRVGGVDVGQRHVRIARWSLLLDEVDHRGWNERTRASFIRRLLLAQLLLLALMLFLLDAIVAWIHVEISAQSHSMLGGVVIERMAREGQGEVPEEEGNV
jgi:hypothetical protein